MRNRERRGRHGHVFGPTDWRHAHDNSEPEGDGIGRHGRGHTSRHGRMGRGGRPFDYGELRLLVLALIAEQPRHGYDLIKAIEDRFAGGYSPSPGVIYPALTMLDEMGLIALNMAAGEGGGRKQYAVTPEGKAHLAAEQPKLDAIMARMSQPGEGRRRGGSAMILRGMENVKMALRLRLAQGVLQPEQENAIAEALDTAARAIERI